MGLDSIAGVQARIAQIQSMFDAGAPGSAPSGASSANATSTEFASLLSDAMASGSLGGTTGTDTTGPGGGSSVLGQLGQLAQLSQATSGSGLSGTNAALATAGGTGSGGGSALALQFLDTALSQKGKPYVYGATASTSDPNPKAFDCSELTKWAAARVGDPIPDGATAQYLYLRDHGTTMTVDQALHTPGALLFHFGHEPKNLGDIPADGHVAISVGDGVHTIEARGHKYGTGIFEATGGRGSFFNFAGMIPGMA